MKRQQELIWDYLVKNALGENNAINISVVADDLGIPPNGTNNDNVRNWIKDMVVKYQKPIGTCHSGAFVILTDEERERAARFLELNIRADSVRNNGNYTPNEEIR